jgi:lysyl-tRNA synthetase class 2
VTAARWWQPERHATRRPALLTRNRIKAAIRRWFEERDFIEIEAAALQASPGNETHLHGLATELVSTAGGRVTRYLHTSPEFAAKKLLAADESRIFDFARVFRNREAGPINATEFTMLEWYRAGESSGAAMDDVGALLRVAAETADAKRFTYRGVSVDAELAPERLTVAQAFARFAAVDLAATMEADGTPIRDALAEAASTTGVRTSSDDSWSDIFSRVMAERIEPNIGRERATLLTDYPAPEAALARPLDGDPRFAERFELFACGVELANGFGELTEPREQRRRFEAAMDEKERIYGERYPIDDDFIAALEIMPEASGVALGFDRLVMLCVGADHIDDVQWTLPATADDNSGAA